MMTIYFDTMAHRMKFCKDASGKKLHMACQENIGPSCGVVYVEDTPLRYGFLQGERRYCVITEEKELVIMFRSVQVRNEDVVILDPRDISGSWLLHEDKFCFGCNGTLYLNRYPIRYSNFGTPFVYAYRNVAVDTEGHPFAPDDPERDFLYWNDYENFPDQDLRFIFGVENSQTGLTRDRRVRYMNHFVTGIPDPVIDLVPVCSTVYALTANGDVYFSKERDNADAKLLTRGITAIADAAYSFYFVCANKDGAVLVFDARFHKKDPIAVIPLNRGRISEIAVHENKLAVKFVNCGIGYYSLPSGRPLKK